MPLGLHTSEVIDDWWSQNKRRHIFYSYPNGMTPLMGLLSLADTEDTPQPQFSWFEQRWEQLKTTTVAGPTSNCVFYNTGTTDTAGTSVTFAAGTVYRIYITDASEFQRDDVLKFHQLPLSSGQTEATFRVNSTNTTGTDFVEAEYVGGASGAVTNNASSVVGKPVIYAGSAFAEGARSRQGRRKFPSEISNYTQIFRTAFSMTGTALKAPLQYSRSGDYRNQLKLNGINHMSGMEWAAFTGVRRATTTTDADNGDTVRVGYMGGLLWYLTQWEKGSTGNGGAFDYRASAVDVSAQTDYITYPDKRIIRLGAGTVTLDQFNEIEALPFQKTNSNENCKLCLCGPGYLAKVNSRLSKEVTKEELRGEQYDGFDFKVVRRSSLLGDVYYKVHPLFSASDSPYRNSAFYIDLGYIKWRPLTDRDTDIRQMIQPNDADYRKDEWLTEGSLEFPYPEAHMFVDQLGGITS